MSFDYSKLPKLPDAPSISLNNTSALQKQQEIGTIQGHSVTKEPKNLEESASIEEIAKETLESKEPIEHQAEPIQEKHHVEKKAAPFIKTTKKTIEEGRVLRPRTDSLNFRQAQNVRQPIRPETKTRSTSLTQSQPTEKKEGGINIPSDPNKFTYDWELSHKNKTYTAEETNDMSPKDMLLLEAKGAKITPQQFMGKASSFQLELSKNKKNTSEDLRTLHELYQKAADGFIKLSAQETRPNAKAKLVELAFKARTEASLHAAPALKESPLYKMQKAVESGQKDQTSPHFPAHFSNVGSAGIVQESSIQAFNRVIEDKSVTQVNLSLTLSARSDLQENLMAIGENPQTFQSSLSSLGITKVTVTEIDDKYLRKDMKTGTFDGKSGVCPSGTIFEEGKLKEKWNSKAIQIQFEGVGTVMIGNTAKCGNQYTRVQVILDQELPDGEALTRAHQMLTVVGLGPAMHPQKKEDDERLKVTKVFEHHFPKEAVKMKRTKEFYEIPLPELISIMESLPIATSEGATVSDVFEKYEIKPKEKKPLALSFKKSNLVEKIEIYPGKKVWAVQDISEQMKSAGAYGLMAGIGKAPLQGAILTEKQIDAAVDTLIKVLLNGAVSAEDLFLAGLSSNTTSAGPDSLSGGNKETFNRLFTENNSHPNLHEDECPVPCKGAFQLLTGLEALNVGGFAYEKDLYGASNPQHENYPFFENHENLPDFAKKIMTASQEGNVMIAALENDIKILQNTSDQIIKEKSKLQSQSTLSSQEEVMLKQLSSKNQDVVNYISGKLTEIKNHRQGLYENEVMIGNTIPKSMQRRVTTQDVRFKDAAVNKLKELKITKINNVELDKFFVVTNNFNQEMWDKK